MREDWKEVTINDVCLKVTSGGTPLRKHKEYYGGDIPWIKTKQVNYNRIYDSEEYLTKLGLANSSAKLIPENSIIIAMYGDGNTAGRCAITKVKATTNQACCNLIINKNIADYNFIFYFLSTQYDKLVSLKSGAGQQNLNAQTIKEFVFKLPQLPTQRKIATILSGYDDLIENNQKRIKILEEMAQQTYEEWFVRMRFPGYETAVFDENGLPEGWEKDSVSNQLDKVQSTSKIKSSDFQIEGNIPVVDQSRAFIAGYTDDETAKIEYNGMPHIVFGDHTRILKLINFDFARGADGTQIVVSKNPCMPQHLFYFSLLNIDLSNYHYARHYKYLKDSEIIIPNKEIANNFEILVEQNFNAIQNLRIQNHRLHEARDILLPRLMMGIIDVESLETKPVEAKIIPLAQPKKEASKEFKEAILIACLTDRFGNEKYPLGRKRYTKLSYLFHRYSDNKIQDYLRKAAGPYNPKTKYGGPEKIALNNKYIQNWKGDKGTTGFVVAEKIDDAKKYFSNYWQIADLDWLVTEFKFKSNDELELLATVDNSLVELSKNGIAFTATNVLAVIQSEKEWEAKLERMIFSEENVERAIGFLRGVLEYNS